MNRTASGKSPETPAASEGFPRQPAMAASVLKFVIIVIALSWASHAFGQVYSQSIYAGGVNYYGDHCIGSYPFRFGFSERSYSTDARGSIIMFGPDRIPQPDDELHDQTQIYLGPVSFLVPIRPLTFVLEAAAGFLLILALGDFGRKYLRRK